jgi:hypothetical protein
MALAVAAAGLIVLTACGGSSSPASQPTASSSGTASAEPQPAATYSSPPAQLPTQSVSLRTTPPPWAPPAVAVPAQSQAYVNAAGFVSAPEMLQVHYHAHLDINADGTKVVVPPYIGFVVESDKKVQLAPLHTHDDTGIIHIENAVPADFLLGQFFIEWGVKFTPTCLGPFCSGSGKELAVFVNGKRYAGDPTRLVLQKHQEIAIEYGDTGQLPTPPSSYNFPAGD